MTAGRDRFTATALQRLARAVAGDELGVPLRDVSADVRDAAGSLAVRLAAPIAVPPLGGQPVEPLTARLAGAGEVIRMRLVALTGLAVERVDLRATGAVIAERRVR